MLSLLQIVADANTGSLYRFDLNENRTELKLGGSLEDKIANTFDETRDIIFANGFGRITDLEIGEDGLMYVLSSEDKLVKDKYSKKPFNPIPLVLVTKIK